MRRPGSLFLLVSLCILTGCQPRGTGPDEAVSPAAPSRLRGAPINLATACAEPWGSGPFTEAGPPLSAPPVTVPARAATEHVSGCSGLRFRIGADGIPTDVDVLVEAPTGYGFGEAAARALRASRWSPRADASFHYRIGIIE